MDCEEQPKCEKKPPKCDEKPPQCEENKQPICDEKEAAAKKKVKAKPAKVDNAPVIEFPRFLRIIGPKQIKILMNFVPSAIIYSVTSLILITYASEWKTVLQYLPYYNGKYKVDSPPPPPPPENEEGGDD